MTANILIVDDDPRMCESLRILFRASDYAVETANSGKDALASLARGRFGIAVVDINLPDAKGIDILAGAKSISPGTTVIIVTGDADLDSALAALKLGAYDYLRKPFEFEELLRTVENAVTQKTLRREKEQACRRLSRSETRYRHLVQNSPDIIYTLDANGNFTFVSGAVARLLGHRAGSLIGRHYTCIVHAEDRMAAGRIFEAEAASMNSKAGGELRLKRREDTPHARPSAPNDLTVEIKSMGIFEDVPQTDRRRRIGTHGVIRDISERKRLQVQLQNAERVEALGTLAGGIAHNFNNLLMGIQGRATLIDMDLDASHPCREHLNAIDEYIHSASELTRQLLGLAHGGKYEVKPTNINALIGKSVRLYGRTKKEVTVETDFDGNDPTVDIDRGQIEQVLLNLYVNAGQAMPDGGTLRISTRMVELHADSGLLPATQPGAYVKISVCDTGVGMDAKTIGRIFDPFFTTKKNQGTGLGLASAYGILKHHNGFIIPHSEIGKGSTFDVYLPIVQKPIAGDAHVDDAVRGGSETLLLVDDEEMSLYVGKELLEKLGYRVIAVASGEAAIETVTRMGGEIDLMILDMVMPGMGGDKVFDRTRRVRPALPVLISSGYDLNGKVATMLRRGCRGFIQKPFTVSEISRKIRRVLSPVPPADAKRPLA